MVDTGSAVSRKGGLLGGLVLCVKFECTELTPCKVVDHHHFAKDVFKGFVLVAVLRAEGGSAARVSRRMGTS